jgi:YVTN family beta-propeller protein
MKAKFVFFVLYLLAGASLAAADTLAEFKVGSSPQRLLLSRDSRVLYVANSGENSITVIEIESGKTSNITVGKDPLDLALSADGLTLYVLNSDDPSVSFVDTRLRAIQRTVKLPGVQRSAYISVIQGDKHPLAYISNVYATPPIQQRLPTGSVSVLDLVDAQIIATVNNSLQAAAIGCAEGNAATLDGRWIFVNTQCRSFAEFAEDPILIIDTQTNTVADEIDMTALGKPNVGTAMQLRTDGKQIWAGGGNACTAAHPTYKHVNCGQPGGDPVTVIDTATRKVVRQLFYGGPSYISFSLDARFAFLATANELLKIDTETFVVAARLPIAGSSGSVVFSADGRYGYTSIPSRNVVVRFLR